MMKHQRRAVEALAPTSLPPGWWGNPAGVPMTARHLHHSTCSFQNLFMGFMSVSPHMKGLGGLCGDETSYEVVSDQKLSNRSVYR